MPHEQADDPGEGKEFSPERVEVFWESMEVEIERYFTELLTEKMRKSEEREEKIKEEIEGCVEREKQFVLKMFEVIEKVVAAHAGERVILFDIDETIGSAVMGADKRLSKTVMRPSLLPLLEKLRSIKCEIGFLTSRGDGYLREQLEDPQNIGAIKEYVDPRRVYSSGGVQTKDSSRFLESVSKSFSDVIDTKLIDPELRESMGVAVIGAQQKIPVIKDIKAGLPSGAALVVVDDLEYPRFLNNANGVYGVDLSEGGMFALPMSFKYD